MEADVASDIKSEAEELLQTVYNERTRLNGLSLLFLSVLLNQ